MSNRPKHEESCDAFENPGVNDWWNCNCRHRPYEEEMDCRQPLWRCLICHAVSTHDGIERHLDWHWERGDFE